MTLRPLAAALVAVAALAPSPAHAADPAHDPSVNCSTWYRQSPSGALVWVGVATVPTDHEAPDSLTIECRYINETGGYSSVHTMPGYVAVTYGPGVLAAGSMTVCESATAHYADGHVGTVPQRCYKP